MQACKRASVQTCKRASVQVAGPRSSDDIVEADIGPTGFYPFASHFGTPDARCQMPGARCSIANSACDQLASRPIRDLRPRGPFVLIPLPLRALAALSRPNGSTIRPSIARARSTSFGLASGSRCCSTTASRAAEGIEGISAPTVFAAARNRSRSIARAHETRPSSRSTAQGLG